MSRRSIVVGLIFAGILISYTDRGNLGIAAPAISKEFGFGSGSMGLLLSAFFWTYAVFQIPVGTIIDRFGVRIVYAGAFLLWSLASSAIGLSQGLASILALRMLLGMAESAGPIASMSYIRRNFTGAQAGLPIGIYIAGQNLGPAAGALLGTQLISHFGWRAMFILTGVGALVWLPGWLWFAPRDDGRGKQRAEKVAVPWAAVAGTAVFWAMPLCIFLSSYFWYFLLTWVPTYLTESRGFSTTEMGRVLSGPLFAMAIVNIVAGWIADRLVKRVGSVIRVRLWFCVAGYVGSGAMLLLLILPARSAVLPVLLVAVCSTGVANANYWAIAQHTSPSNLVGRVIGYLNTISQVAGATAPLITGWILGPQKQFDMALAIAGVSAPLAAVCLLVAGAPGLERTRRLLDQTDSAL